MKRTILIEFFLLFSLISLIIAIVHISINTYSFYQVWLIAEPDLQFSESSYYDGFNSNLIQLIIVRVGALCTIASMVMLAIKDFPVFAPMIERRKKKKAERKERHKKKRITELEKQLNELKKDGN